MNTFKTLVLGLVALVALTAAPAQAHERCHHRHYRGGHRIVVYSTPYYYRSYNRPYYSDYGYYDRDYYPYYRPYSYYSGPTITFGFGGHHFRHYHHWR